MAEPNMELDASATGTPTTYDIPIINNNTYDTTKVIRWGDGDSAVGTITNVTLPSSGDQWAPECWIEDTDGTDVLCCDSDEQPDAGTPRAMMFYLSSDAAYATAPRITAWDSNSHAAVTEEIFTGTTNNSNVPFLKARGQTVNTAPSAAHWNEASEAASHDIDTSGTCGNNTGTEENAALEGDTNYLTCSAADISGTPQYFSLALSIPDDATTGVDAIDCVLTIRYTYT
jgi:hypothetical protein